MVGNDIYRQVKGTSGPAEGLHDNAGGLGDLGEGAAGRPRHDRAYFLDLLGDSQGGLGRHEAAIEAYRQAARDFEAQGARCSYALCLLKIADGYLALHEPWHAVGYLEACLPLLQELGLTRYFGLAQSRLTGCHAELAQVGLSRRPDQYRHHRRPGQQHLRWARGRFGACPVQTDSRIG